MKKGSDELVGDIIVVGDEVEGITDTDYGDRVFAKNEIIYD